MRRFLQRLAAGRREKGYAVFAPSAHAAERMILHLADANQRSGAALPIWLMSRAAPSAELAALCAAAVIEPNAWKLSARALRFLRGRWPALSVVGGAGERGAGPLPWLAFLLPPFRVVILNRHGDFLSARPRALFRNAAFGVAGALAPPLAPLLRYAARHFTRAVDGRRIVPEAPPLASLREALVIEYRGRDWDHAAVETRLRQAPQRWVVFREAGHAVDLGRALDLAAGATFAVSAQIGFRAWRKLPLPNAPFRALQPGEVSRTLAPLSNFIVADREKVLALGVPRELTWGAAWYALFWKAAAAGWPSYSAGVGACGQMPDYTLEEAEFLHHAFWDRPPLRALAPVDEDLARGNIAFAPAARQPFREGLPRVLVVSPYLPFPLSHGGAVRMYNLCRALAGRVDFLLACFREQGEPVEYGALSEIFREIYVVDNDQKPQPGAEPRQVREYASAAMHRLIGHLAAGVDVLQIEYTQLAAYRDAAPHTPAILVEHDLTFTLYQQAAARRNTAAARAEAERWRRFESRQWAAFDAVWTMSDDDRAEAVAAGAPAERTLVVANGVDLQRFRCAEKPDAATAADPVLLYVGSFRHHPNLAGFEQLRDRIMPLVWERVPAARLVVVAGPRHETYWTAGAADPRMEVHGFVSDVRPLYEQADVVCVPLPISAGTNIKVMEALACGRAVVSNAVGARGLGLTDGQDIVIREIGPEFAAAVCDLLQNHENRKRIGRQARLTSERRFGWQAIAGIALENYTALRAVSANQIYSQ